MGWALVDTARAQLLDVCQAVGTIKACVCAVGSAWALDHRAHMCACPTESLKQQQSQYFDNLILWVCLGRDMQLDGVHKITPTSARGHEAATTAEPSRRFLNGYDCLENTCFVLYGCPRLMSRTGRDMSSTQIMIGYSSPDRMWLIAH